MVDIMKLKGKIVECGMSVGRLADKMGIDRATLYRRMSNNGDSFTIKEANQIKEILDLTYNESMAIFFKQVVA